MKLASIRLVTRDMHGLVGFYETLMGAKAAWLGDDFAEIATGGSALAICTERSTDQFNASAAKAGANQSGILEFQVDDVDALRSRLASLLTREVMTPVNQPWGNRSMLVRDPDGTLINIFARIKP